jgi:uncharacterized membrane protein
MNNNLLHDDANRKNINISIIPSSWGGVIVISILFCLFLAVTSYKLTNASLWLDEGLDYLFSVMPFGKMISTLRDVGAQPPLYSFLLHFLLKISTGEYWFRFTSVLFGLFGCVGLYAAVNAACGWKVAGFAIFFYTFLRNSVYYNQECAEYTLVVCVLFWAVYFFISLLNGFSYKKAVGFTVFCILSIYSQYGAVFPLIGLSVSLLLFYGLNKQWRIIKRLIALMGAAVALFGIPLYFGLARDQFKANIAYLTASPKPFTGLFEELQMFIGGLDSSLSFHFSAFYRNPVLIALMDIFYVLVVCAIVWSTLKNEDRRIKYVGLSTIITYMLYYMAVRCGVYAHGSFGSRYSLAVLPVVLVGAGLSLYALFLIVQNRIQKKGIKFAYVHIALILILLSFHNYSNWLTIQKNWGKEDVRAGLNLWLDETNGKDEIYVYYAATSVFAFYAKNLDLDYGKEAIANWKNWGAGIDPETTQYKNYHYGESMRGQDTAYVKNSIRKSFSDNMPDSLWFMLSHIHPDNQTYMDAFSELGYGYQVYRWADARLLRLYNSDYLADNYLTVTDDGKTVSEYVSDVDQMKRSLQADGSVLLQAESDDPKIYLTLPQDLNYDKTQTHKVLIEFESAYAGNLQLFCKYRKDAEFSIEDVVNSQYTAGHNRVFVDIPEYARLETLRLDMDNGNVPSGSENAITLIGFSVFEASTPDKAESKTPPPHLEDIDVELPLSVFYSRFDASENSGNSLPGTDIEFGSDGEIADFVMHGPYISASAGEMRWTADLTLAQANRDDVGFVDITCLQDGGIKTIASRVITKDEFRDGRLSVTLSHIAQEDLENVEFRVFANDGVVLGVDSVRVCHRSDIDEEM